MSELHTRVKPSWQGTVTVPFVSDYDNQNCNYFLIFATVLVLVKVEHIIRDLIALLAVQSQGIDSIAQVLLNLSSGKAGTLSLRIGDLEIL